MRRFRAAISHCQLKEIHLQNRKYTWSNERRHPTLVRLDRVFCNESWDLAFENHSLHALSSSHSDHCPILLAHHQGWRKPTPFRFENFWTKLPRKEEASTTTSFTSEILRDASTVTGRPHYSSSSISQKPLTLCAGTTCLP